MKFKKFSWKSIDTITTKLLMLVLFIVVIPIVVIANFSTGIISESMLDSTNSELTFNSKLASEKYFDELKVFEMLAIQATKSHLPQLLAGNLKTFSIINKELNDLKDCTKAENVLLIDKKGNSYIKDVFFVKNKEIINDIAQKAFKEGIVSSSEIFIGKNPEISFVTAVPIANNSQILVFVKNISTNTNIKSFFGNISSATLSIYELYKNKTSVVLTNLQNPKDIENYQIKEKILNLPKNQETILLRTPLSGGVEIGQIKTVKGISGNITGIIYIGIKENKFIEPVNKNLKLMSIISVISLVVSIIIAALFARTITTPVLKLVAAAEIIATGNLKLKVKSKGNDEIARLAKSFNDMTYNLNKQNTLRDNFVATLTHDLKVPMLAENQTIDYLVKEAYGPINEEQKEVLELIKSTNMSSLEMIATLLDIYKYDMGKIKISKSYFDIVQLAQTCIAQVNSLARERNIKINLQSEPDEIFVNADEMEIKRVFHNLISNAIDNGNKNGNIDISIEMKKEGLYRANATSTVINDIDLTNTVFISVKDDGVGIAKEDIPLLFDRFSLSKGRKPAGTGLGLYYSSQVIETHGGMIWAETIEGVGSTFMFKLPLDEGDLDE